MQYKYIFQVAVVGVPDKRLGENICASVVPQKGMTLCSDDMIKCFDEIYKTDEGLGITPGYFMFVDAIPLKNGKIDKKALR